MAVKGTFAAAAVLGHPVGHSRSPLIHSYWLREHHLTGAYLALEIRREDLGTTLQNLRALGLRGVNLTMPLKEEGCAHVVCDETATLLQAVNTLWFEGETLHGTSTDGAGFIASLDECAPQWRDNRSHVAVLGAGGAARAIIHALFQNGVEHVTLLNRSAERAEQVQQIFGQRILCASLSAQADIFKSVDLLINTTSLGMIGQPTLDVDVTHLPPHAIVADIVYVPLETPLLQSARQAGYATVDGLGMLLHQAVPGFAQWFGVRPHVTPQLRAHIIEKLEQNR